MRGRVQGNGAWLNSDANSGKYVGGSLQTSCSLLYKNGDGEGTRVSQLWATVVQQKSSMNTPACSDTSPSYLCPGGERQGPQKLREPHALLMETYAGHSFSEKCLEVSVRTEYMHILWPSNFIPRYIPKPLSVCVHQKGTRVFKADKSGKYHECSSLAKVKINCCIFIQRTTMQ